MTKQITITVTSPIDCTDEQFNEWVKFCVHYTAEMSLSNPLHEYDMESDTITIN